MKRWGVAICFISSLLFCGVGLAALWNLSHGNLPGAEASLCAWPPPQTVAALGPGTVAAMDSAPIAYSAGWQVDAAGADPPEPADPAGEPAGTVTFSYTGDDLYLLLAPGDYWAYLFVTVDGQPANRLPALAGVTDSRGLQAGYKPLLAPERAALDPVALLVHQDAGAGVHAAAVEVWRAWGQTPLRGLAVDPLVAAPLAGFPPAGACGSRPQWPAALLLGLGIIFAGVGVWLWFGGRPASSPVAGGPPPPERTPSPAEADWPAPAWAPLRTGPPPAAPAATKAGALGLALVAAGVAFSSWWLCLPGLGLLALAGVMRPALWLGALLFGLPFAFGLKLPLLPTRAFDLIDIGVWGGVAVLAGHLALLALLRARRQAVEVRPHAAAPVPLPWPLLALGAIVIWALGAALAATYPDLALREWRVVFLNALLFGVLLALTLRWGAEGGGDLWLLVAAWLAGGAAVSLAGLWGYAAGNELVSQAEGVRRIQAFYGSGNNLALYLDRTLAVTLGLALFTPDSRPRIGWSLLAAPQALAWLLTFSKGSLLLAGPAMALVLLLGGVWLLRGEGRSLRPLWTLLGLGLLAGLALTPFLGAERFQRLFDFGEGTGFLRLQLWRSAWQMALDHPLLGVGPDNFLYAYRSGYLLPGAWQEPNLNHPHNLLLDWWTRLGGVGLVLGTVWLGSGVAAVLRWLRNGPQRALALGVLAACAAGLAHGLIDVSYALPDLMIVWVLLFGLGQPAPGEPYAARFRQKPA